MKYQLAEILKQVGHSGSSLVVALMKDSESPFVEPVQTRPIPDRFKLLTLESYNGLTDVMDH